ncbi:D-lactaldehyde dehydrogenase [Trametes elegans]|nr:D-lactaldehyde dehydrogenase [Trametes elegans]
MPTISPPEKILVTGANGYIGRWIVRDLLERGCAARGAVRTAEKAPSMAEYVASTLPDAKDRFQAVGVPEIATPEAFHEAVRAVGAVVHTAPVKHLFNDPQGYIRPAVEGTLNVLGTALQYVGMPMPSVKRVVHTSSMATILNVRSEPRVCTEGDWNDEVVELVDSLAKEAGPFDNYYASKTLAERAAMEFMDAHRPSAHFDLCVLNPTWVYGPTAGEPLASPDELPATPLHTYQQLFVATPPTNGFPYFNYVDVRDVAAMHAGALAVPEADGERVICNAAVSTWDAWRTPADLTGFKKPAGATALPHPHVWLAIDKAKRIFGESAFRTVGETVRDVVKDYKARGWLKHMEA